MVVPPPPPAWPEVISDTECYVNYWLCAFSTGNDVEIWNGQCYVNQAPVTREVFARFLDAYLHDCTLIGFNIIGYDMPLITLALNGASEAEIKRNSDAMIVHGVKHWDVARPPEWVDVIDLLDVSPGDGSLKSYAARMHAKRLQDLPIDPAETIDAEKRAKLRDYCKTSDIPATALLRQEMSAQIELRKDMSKEYGIDLRSKSDAQIAEAVMKSLLPFKVQKPQVSAGAQFYFKAASWIKFQTPVLNELLAQITSTPFWINHNGSPVPDPKHTFIDWADTQLRRSESGEWAKRPKGWAARTIPIKAANYAVGSGGLHSTESAAMHVADATTVISDHDVASYYPSLIIRTGIYPTQIGPQFLEIYTGWYKRRLEAKAAKIKKKANSLKTLLNGTFGKLGSMWSIFYAPSQMIQVTITGQLALLMLIERLEICGITVISANTDGIVLKTPVWLVPVRDLIIREWERDTGLETEANLYRLLASRDVNSYIAITPDGTVKTKGDYADPVPGASGWPNPKRQVCVNAVIAYLRDGIPIPLTIRTCQDLRDFVCMIKVTGGGSLCPDGVLEKKPTQKFMRSLCGEHLKGPELVEAYARLCEAEAASRQYLGKTVRWYYATGSRACIVTPKGGLVSRTEGCKPIMEFPDEFPVDIDYAWYEDEAVKMLHDIGAVV